MNLAKRNRVLRGHHGMNLYLVTLHVAEESEYFLQGVLTMGIQPMYATVNFKQTLVFQMYAIAPVSLLELRVSCK